MELTEEVAVGRFEELEDPGSREFRIGEGEGLDMLEV